MKNLIITTIGKGHLANDWNYHLKKWDICLVKYEDCKVNFQPEYMYEMPGFKYPTLYQILLENPRLWEYDYYWMPDEDIKMGIYPIGEFFMWAAKNQVELAQPSIKKENWTWPTTLNDPKSKWRQVTQVEIMCPLFSNWALTKCLESFKMSRSGWGLEAIWSKNVQERADKIMICDFFAAHHTRPIKLNGGRLYNKLKEETGMIPHEEMRQLLTKNNVKIDFRTLKKFS